jgi:methyltransferase (TIGR00027 family)
MSRQPIRNVSDTALWAAVYRARETERPDALFRDPLARKLAGTRGEDIGGLLPAHHQNDWAWITRTVLFDRFLLQRIAGGADTVVNLAAGLDARPYRMQLPPTLHWIEADLPELIAYKEELLRDETPTCRLERVAVDLADRAARKPLFDRIAAEAKNAVVLTEGLVIYLTREGVAELAEDLAAIPAMHHWIVDVVSPGLRTMLQKQIGKELDAANAPLLFSPTEGAGFFEPHGWRAAEVQSVLHAAAQLKRLKPLFRFFALFPPPKPPLGKQPSSAVVLLENGERLRRAGAAGGA